MRYISFSFDDAREDTYTNAFRLLKKYGYSATINVTSGFVLNPDGPYGFASSANKAMTIEQLKECSEYGIELACHGSKHINTLKDVECNISELSSFGIPTDNIGFASPGSKLTIKNKNDDGIWDLVECGRLSYIRSGTVIRREGFMYAALSAIDMLIHSKNLFYYLNKRNIFRGEVKFIPSVAIYSYTTVNQILHIVNKMKDGDKVVLMFHSILSPFESGYEADKYYWDSYDFELLLSRLKKEKDLTILPTIDLINVE